MAAFQSVAHMFRDRVASTPDLEAFSFKKGGAWTALSWTQVAAEVDQLAGGLKALGIDDEQRVGILSNTRIEWLLADIGIMCAFGAATTIYPSSTAEDCQYILENSDSVLCFVENDDQVAKLASKRDSLPDLQHLIVIDGTDGAHDGWVIGWDAFKARGAAWNAANPNGLAETIARCQPDNLATLIYTSGTTGQPKGVELLHDCWLFEGEAVVSLGIMTSADKQFLWLPMSHSFGKVLETLAIAAGVPTAVDGEIPKIVENLAIIKPTFMAAAPRIFEKVYNKVISGAKQAGGLKYTIFKWSVGVGTEVSKIRQRGGEPSGMLAIKHKIADKLVFSKLRALFGDRVRYFISGSAPLNRDIAEFFHAAGLLILEGYGLTESSAASFVNTPQHNKFGTVGKPLPGIEVKIASDGEILFKGRGVMRGYYKMPEVTEETLVDGWLHTGDIGEIDADGHLKITDRKKNLIKTSGGKYVAPQALEGAFKAVCTLVGQIVVHGDKRNFCSALITADPDAIVAWAEANEITERDYTALTKHPKVLAEFQEGIDRLNTQLASFETIKKWALLPEDFTIEGGELTPSLKVKRKAVEKKYASVLEGFYDKAFEQL